MSNPAAAEEPPRKRRKISPSPSSSSYTLLSLPDELIWSCLARVARTDHAALSRVSKNYRSLVASSGLYETRSLLGYAEFCLYVCLLTPSDPTPRWFILRRKKSMNPLLLSIPPLPYQSPEASSVVVVDRAIYVIGGRTKGRCTSAVGLLDCRTHKWHRVPSMRVARASAAVGVVGGKIYVFGGCRDSDSSNWAEVFDPKTQTWSSLPPMPDRTIRCQYIHDSVVVRDEKEKVYAVDDFDKTFRYTPSEGQWGRGSTCPLEINRRDWCVVDRFIYSIDSIGNVYWCEPCQLNSEQGEIFWKRVKGLTSLNERLSRSRLIHFDSKLEAMWESQKIKLGRNKKLIDLLPGVRLSYLGPNIVLFWDVIDRDRLEIWCAEVSLELRQGPEMWGNIEWSNAVMTSVDTFTDHYRVLHSVSVSL